MSEERFDFLEFSSFEGVDEKRRDISEFKDYMDKHPEKTSITKSLNIGDVVKLKYSGYVVKVEQLNCEFTQDCVYQYAGRRVDVKDSDRLSLFNQEDIESIVELSEKEEER